MKEENKIEFSPLREMATECKHEMKIKVDDKYLEDLGEYAELEIINQVVRHIVDEKYEEIKSRLDYGKIAEKVQQSIINTLTIKELRETLKYKDSLN